MVGTRKTHVPSPTLAARLARRRTLTANGCLEWTGYFDPVNGYGKIANPPGAPLSCHVAAWITVFGPVPLGLLVRHKCDNALCMEVRHLELGTDRDNAHDMVERGRCRNPPKLFCPRGHPHDTKDHAGYGQCSICQGINHRKSGINRRRKLGKAAYVENCNSCYYALERCRCVEFGISSNKTGELIL